MSVPDFCDSINNNFANSPIKPESINISDLLIEHMVMAQILFVDDKPLMAILFFSFLNLVIKMVGGGLVPPQYLDFVGGQAPDLPFGLSISA